LGAEIAKQIVRYRGLYPGDPIQYVFDSNGGNVPPIVKNMLGAKNVSDISDGIARNYMADMLGIDVGSVTPTQIDQGKREILAAITSPGQVNWSTWP
jgi:hypothetical protein